MKRGRREMPHPCAVMGHEMCVMVADDGDPYRLVMACTRCGHVQLVSVPLTPQDAPGGSLDGLSSPRHPPPRAAGAPVTAP